jgi:hypothetical protein
MLLVETARSSLARGISKGNLAEGLMAFNTNYRDTGIFGIYAIASVMLIIHSTVLVCLDSSIQSPIFSFYLTSDGSINYS